jgi:3-isopropylmalate/(R)-2-methylmalate dehydratase small subunit
MAEQFTHITAKAAPLLRASIDTDAIIPSREINTATRTGLADGLFAGWRYRAIGSRQLAADFVLNNPLFSDAKILITGDNFGCGSSREHAVWALREYGFRAVIAPGFAPIFQANCMRNGLVPVRLSPVQVDALSQYVLADPAVHLLTVDLAAQTVAAGNAFEMSFEIDATARECLLFGLDIIDLSLRHAALIEAFVTTDRAARPWVYSIPDTAT